MATKEELMAELESIKPNSLSVQDKILGLSRSALGGLMLGFGDNAEAFAASLINGNSYQNELSQIQNEQANFKNKVDYLDNAVEIGTSFLNPLSLLGKIRAAGQGASVLSKIANNPLAQKLSSNAIEGGLQAVGDSNSQTLGEAATDFSKGAFVSWLVPKTLEKGADVLQSTKKEADRLLTSAYGVTYHEMLKNIKKNAGQILDDSPAMVDIIQGAEKKGILNVKNPAGLNFLNVLERQKTLGDELQTLLKEADNVAIENQNKLGAFGVPIQQAEKTKFNITTKNTDAYVESLSGTAREEARKTAKKELEVLKKQAGESGLSELQNLKTGYNYIFETNPNRENVIKAIRKDLKESIENGVDTLVKEGKLSDEYLGKVKQLNQEFGGLAEYKDVLARKFAKEFSGDAVNDVFNTLRTTQGTGSLNIMSAVSGNPIFAAAGLAANLTRSDKAKRNLADLLYKNENLLNSIGKKVEGFKPRGSQTVQITDDILRDIPLTKDWQDNPNITPNENEEILKNQLNSLSIDQLIGELLAPQEEITTSNQSIGDLLNMLIDKKKSSNTMIEDDNKKKDSFSKATEVIEQIKMNPIDHAIMMMESAGDYRAKNPTSTASGLFQLISSTAKNLGVKDVFDPEENYKGYLELKNRTIKNFGGQENLELIYSSHYLGEPTLRKWLNGEELSELQKKHVKELQDVLLPRLNKIYNRILKTKNNGGLVA